MEKKLTLNEYQREAEKTAIYKEKIVYPAVGLVGEAGEVADKIKKIMRDSNGIPTDNDKTGVILELGDTLWYSAILMRDYGMEFNAVEDYINKAGFRRFFALIQSMDSNQLAVKLSMECAETSLMALECAKKNLDEPDSLIQCFIAECVARIVALINQIAKVYNSNLNVVGLKNIEKLQSRAKRNAINGSGDER